MTWKITGGVATLLAFGAVLAYGYVLGGWFTTKRSVAEHNDLISAHYGLALPEEQTGVVPAAVLVPGCLGTWTHHRAWADLLNAKGWATLIVDSFAPRGITNLDDLEAVCEGARPWGFERAGDLVAAVAHLTQDARIDPNRIMVFGWSNGAWAVMDALSFGPRSKPTNLNAISPDWSAGVRGAVLFYPYCGFGTRSASRGWTTQVPTVLFLAEDDENLPPETCSDAADRLIADGATIDRVLLDGATHWFDNPSDFDVLPHRYDRAATERARAKVTELLAAIDAHSPTLSMDHR